MYDYVLYYKQIMIIVEIFNRESCVKLMLAHEKGFVGDPEEEISRQQVIHHFWVV